MDYDMGHGNAEDCQWIMTCANADESPIVIFHTFNTETNFDYVNIYDGPDVSAPRIGRFHGTDLPGVTALSSNVGVLQFTSDGSVTRDGFHASFTCSSVPAPPPPPDPGAPPVVYDGSHDAATAVGTMQMMLDMDAGHANGATCRPSPSTPSRPSPTSTSSTSTTALLILTPASAATTAPPPRPSLAPPRPCSSSSPRTALSPGTASSASSAATARRAARRASRTAPPLTRLFRATTSWLTARPSRTPRALTTCATASGPWAAPPAWSAPSPSTASSPRATGIS